MLVGFSEHLISKTQRKSCVFIVFSSLDYLSHRLPTPANCRSTYQHFRFKNHPKSASKMTWKLSEIYTGSHIASKMDSKATKNFPKRPQSLPKTSVTVSNSPPDASRCLQNASRRPPERPQNASKAPQKGSNTAAKDLGCIFRASFSENQLKTFFFMMYAAKSQIWSSWWREKPLPKHVPSAV